MLTRISRFSSGSEQRDSLAGLTVSVLRTFTHHATGRHGDRVYVGPGEDNWKGRVAHRLQRWTAAALLLTANWQEGSRTYLPTLWLENLL